MVGSQSVDVASSSVAVACEMSDHLSWQQRMYKFRKNIHMGVVDKAMTYLFFILCKHLWTNLFLDTEELMWMSKDAEAPGTTLIWSEVNRCLKGKAEYTA